MYFVDFDLSANAEVDHYNKINTFLEWSIVKYLFVFFFHLIFDLVSYIICYLIAHIHVRSTTC